MNDVAVRLAEINNGFAAADNSVCRGIIVNTGDLLNLL
jgi:hypothetical protein